MTTILLKSGTIIDGTGRSAFQGSVLIEGNRIAAVLRENEEIPHADIIINTAGNSIAPGFIDVHSHVDWLMPAESNNDLLQCLLEQGITTVIAGNCGASPAPVHPETIGLIKIFENLLVDSPLNYEWKSMAEFLDHIEEKRPLVNIAQLVGHGIIRFATGNYGFEPIPHEKLPDSLNMMQQSFEEGACGLSLGLAYYPGIFSSTEEIEAFCNTAKSANKIVTVHLKALARTSPAYPLFPNFRPHNLQALSEMIEIA